MKNLTPEIIEKAKAAKNAEELLELAKANGVEKIALAGGVASNSTLRAKMEEACEKNGFTLSIPSPVLCTDNAAMIGCAAYYEYMAGMRDGLELNANPSLRLGDR